MVPLQKWAQGHPYGGRITASMSYLTRQVYDGNGDHKDRVLCVQEIVTQKECNLTTKLSRMPKFIMGNRTFCVELVAKIDHKAGHQKCNTMDAKLPLPKSMEEFKTLWNVLKTLTVDGNSNYYSPDSLSPFYIDMADSAGKLRKKIVLNFYSI